RTVKSIDPAGYAGSLITHPFAWAVIALAAGLDTVALTPVLGLTFAAITCRLLLLGLVARVFALPPQPYWLVPVRGLWSFAVFVGSFFGRDVRWKGRSFREVSGGEWLATGASNTR